MKTLGQLSPDPVAVVLGTGFKRFESPTGAVGLVRVTGRAVDLLAIDTAQHGCGMFRRFVGQLKTEADQITFLVILNPDKIGRILTRYGFEAVDIMETHPDGVEWVKGMRWQKEKTK